MGWRDWFGDTLHRTGVRKLFSKYEIFKRQIYW